MGFQCLLTINTSFFPCEIESPFGKIPCFWFLFLLSLCLDFCRSIYSSLSPSSSFDDVYFCTSALLPCFLSSSAIGILPLNHRFYLRRVQLAFVLTPLSLGIHACLLSWLDVSKSVRIISANWVHCHWFAYFPRLRKYLKPVLDFFKMIFYGERMCQEED